MATQLSTPASHSQSGLGRFLMVAFGFTWLCWTPGLILASCNNLLMPNFDTYHQLWITGFEGALHATLSALFFLGVYGPLLGAYISIRFAGDRSGLRYWRQQITYWRVTPSWYGMVLLLVLVIGGIPFVLFTVLGGLQASEYSLGWIAALFVIQILRSGLGEEPGWRGYMLPILRVRYSGERYIWVMGLIWSLWHLPIVITQTLQAMADQSMLPIVLTLLTAVAGNIMALIGMSYLYVWVLNRTGSIWLLMVLHAASNVLVLWMISFLVLKQTAGFAVALMPWFWVILLQWRLGKTKFPGEPLTAIPR
ncbi:CPBP family intramembrane glutamic endopeptidase [Reinekea sp. G2M2-21]|uniref:CPBP family intramembrane glutamic endopeptidase n=1 Tax=Reinekea sp. G2M2-21 TaxID=2788942 RepID=UPI0018ABE31F|nr:CPBP family intramembrane glutamic endopeptidase [Reinekea sp. G2M2-21]